MSTMTATLDTRAKLDTILCPYEQRPVSADRDTIVSRRAGANLGNELNRLQGAVATEADARLDRLWRNAQITKTEYVKLATEIARQGLFKDIPSPSHGR